MFHTEPYNYFGRRGRKEPEALAAASLKRLFVENQPYLVTGYNQHELFGNLSASTKVNISKYSTHDDGSDNISSMLEKYKFMRDTFRKRLAFGKLTILPFSLDLIGMKNLLRNGINIRFFCQFKSY